MVSGMKGIVTADRIEIGGEDTLVINCFKPTDIRLIGINIILKLKSRITSVCVVTFSPLPHKFNDYFPVMR